jgi:outer membrane protein assembly factor BamD
MPVLRTRSAAALLAVACFSALTLLAGCSTAKKKDDRSAEQMYTEAMDDFNGGSWDSSIKQFDAIQARYPFGRIAQQSQINEAYAQYRQGDTEQSLQTIERFLKQYPDHPALDYMLYLRGLVNFSSKVGFWGWVTQQDPSERDPKALRDAYDAFRELLDRFPNSKYAEDARLRSGWLINAMGDYEVHVARYYYRRGAWLAAANRAQGAIKQYDAARSSEEAFGIMIAAYDKLGLTQQRDDARRVMEANFPNSKYAREDAIIEPIKPWYQIW